MVYNYLLKLLDSNEQDEIQQQYPEDSIRDDEKKIVGLCAELSKKWIIRRLSVPSDKETVNEKTKHMINSILNLKFELTSEYNALIYSYFIYFLDY
jgi:hypothetical protein